MRANGTVHDRSNKDLVEEINGLKLLLEKLSETMEGEAEGTVGRALDGIEARSKVAIDSAIRAAQDFVDGHGDTVRNATDAISQRTSGLRDAATDSLATAMKSRPLGTVAAIVGIGFLAGYLWRRT